MQQGTIRNKLQISDADFEYANEVAAQFALAMNGHRGAVAIWAVSIFLDHVTAELSQPNVMAEQIMEDAMSLLTMKRATTP